MLTFFGKRTKHQLFTYLGAVSLGIILFFPKISLAFECAVLTRKINYTVRSGDTLGSILYSHEVGPLWGPNRYVELTAKVNSISTRTTLMPGQIITIPLKCEHEAQTFARKELPPVITTETINVPSPVPLTPISPAKIIERNVAAEESDDDSEYSTFIVDLIGQYSALSGKDISNNTAGRLLSKFDPGMRLTWAQNWNSFLRSNIFVEAQNISLKSEKSGVPLENASMTNSAFGFGLHYLPADRWILGATIAQRPEIFYQGALVGNGLEFAAVPLFSVTPDVSYKLLQGKKLSLSVHAGFSYYSSASYDDYAIGSGSGLQGGISIKHQLESGSDVHCLGYYKERNQNTSILEFAEKQTGLTCGFGWRL